MKEYDPHDSVEFIYKTAPDYAKAKGELAQLESFKHSLRSIKMAQAEGSSMAAKEMEAYRSPEYQELCKANRCSNRTSRKIKMAIGSSKNAL